MYNYNSLEERSKRHYTEAHVRENKTFIKDPACVICYPPKEIDEKFYKFWDWYGTELPVATYSATTIRIFQELLGQDINEKSQTQTKLLQLIGSIRYSEEPDLTIPDIAIKVLERIVCSEGFELSSEQTEKNIELSYEQAESTKEESLPESGSEEKENNTPEKETPEQTEEEQEELFDTGFEEEIERTLKDINTELESSSEEKPESEKSEETEELINAEDLELTSETESETSEYNLNLLFGENLVNMAAPTFAEMRTLFESTFGAHGENMRPIMKVKEFYGRDDEDPHEWCAEFEKACAANGWTGDPNNVRRKDIAASYLRGNAAEWYGADQANIVQWHIDGQNDNFRERFKDHFSPESKQIQWQFELTNIKQGTGESIEDYSRRFKSVMRKVNHTNVLAAGVQVNYFIKGLNPIYVTQVMMSNPANLNAAVTQAKLLETGTQIAGLSIWGNVNQVQENNNTQVKKNTFMREKDVKGNEMDELTEMMKRMEIKMANIEQGKINRNGNNKGCFNCGRTGHIARECRSQRNSRQEMRIKTCNECGKTGHTTRECYRNRTCERCGRKGHTREVCRNTISNLNYTEIWDNEDEFYDDNDYEEEAYMTLKSGKKTHTPEFAKRLQDQGHQKPKPIVIQGGQVYEENQQGPKKNKRGRKKMVVDGEEEYEVKPTRGDALVDKVKPYSMIDIIGNVQAPVSIAQLLKDPKNQRELRNFMKRTSHVELAEADEEY